MKGQTGLPEGHLCTAVRRWPGTPPILLVLALVLLLGQPGLADGPGAASAVGASIRTHPAAQSSITLIAVADATLSAEQQDSNFGGATSLDVSWWDDAPAAPMRALLRFNLAAAVPPEAIIDSAVLHLYLTYGSGADPVELTASCVVTDWVEAEVTWTTRPGVGEPVLTSPVGTALGTHSLDVTAIVQAWHNIPHYGLELSGPEGVTNHARTFESREAGAHPPQLEVTYHLPPLPQFSFMGHVYLGSPPATESPLEGAWIELYGDEDGLARNGPGAFLATTSTDSSGAFTLDWQGEPHPFYHLFEMGPPDTYSTGAQAVPPGNPSGTSAVTYEELPAGTYGGIAFWDRPLPEGCPQLLVNGDFEAGELSPWGSDGAVGLGAGWEGGGAWLAGADDASGELWQAVSIPAGSDPAILAFWWQADSEVQDPGDVLQVVAQFDAEEPGTLLTLRNVGAEGGWRYATADLAAYAGQRVGLTFHALNNSEVPTTFRLDNVRLLSCGVGLPDLVVTDVWEEGGLICYQIQNVRDPVAEAGHLVTLRLDGELQDGHLIEASLGPGERAGGCFDAPWVCSEDADQIGLRADAENVVPEASEENNAREETWQCDLTPPLIIEGPVVAEVTQNSAVVSWFTDEEADSLVRYGEIAGPWPSEQGDPTLAAEHHIALADLQPSTTYRFVARSADAGGNAVEGRELTFQTLPVPDTVEPSVALVEPATCQGVVPLEAIASDDIGLERVEFSVDGALAFIRYAPGTPALLLETPRASPLAATAQSPSETVAASRGRAVQGDPGPPTPDFGYNWDTLKYLNGPHDLGAMAVDLAGGSSASDLVADACNASRLTPPAVILTSPQDGSQVSGTVLVTAEVSDDAGIYAAYLAVDGTYEDAQYFSPHPLTATVALKWDTSGSNTGWYYVCAAAHDAQLNLGSDCVTVNVVTAPTGKPKLDVTEHTATRMGTGFVITLKVENKGTATARKVSVYDWLSAFQPISRQDPYADYVAGFNAMTTTCSIESHVDLAPGSSQTFVYAAVPVLIHDQPPPPSIGQQVGLNCEDIAGTLYDFAATAPVPFVSGNVPLATAYDQALKEADYLIVTVPDRLLALNPSEGQEIDGLLSDMAELASLQQGALGYLRQPDRNILKALIKPGGQWAKKLHPRFSSPAPVAGWVVPDIGGYLLIVGETEVVPAWDLSGFNRCWSDGTCTNVVHHSDHGYADTTGPFAPDLIVGRAIGNDPARLREALQASVGVTLGLPGYEFDRSHALLVSGTDSVKENLQKMFVAQVKNVNLTLAQKQVNTDILHWKDHPSDTQRYQQFKTRVSGKDMVLFIGHGSPSCWCYALYDWFPFSLGQAKPLIYAASCSTGDYENVKGADVGIAEAFFDNGAAVYIGATERAGFEGPLASRDFFSNWDSDRTAGWVHTTMEGVYLATTSGDTHDDWRYFVAQFNIYGDPKFGAVAPPPPGPTGEAAPAAAGSDEPPLSVEVVVPEFEVESEDGIDHVRIPGGMLLLLEGQPQVPYYAAAAHYPQGYRVQEVTLAERGDDLAFSGLNLPVTTNDAYPAAMVAPSGMGEAGGWFPETDYDWRVVDHPDGSSTLVIQVYAFHYNPLTAEARFTPDYRFDVGYVTTPVSITELSTGKAAYEPGELVRVDLALTNEGDGQDVVVQTAIVRYGPGGLAAGLPLRTLHDLRGEAAYSAYWSSEGVEPGHYQALATLLDTGGNVLARQSATFQVGNASGEIVALTAGPELFEVGQPVGISLVLSSTGTTEISGTVVIQVQNAAGQSVHTFQHAVAGLAPGQSVGFDDEWDTSGAIAGRYAIVGYALYDSTATDPRSAFVHASGRLHLPLVLRH